MTHLTPLREKRDRLAKELRAKQPNDEILSVLIDECIDGNLKAFMNAFYEDECLHCGSPLETWLSAKHEEFFIVCQIIAKAELSELQNALGK